MIGAIDGSLIPVRGPNRWNGSVHDSAVFNASNLHVQREGGRGRNGGLLGDRGFGIQLYLMTPLRPDHVTTVSRNTVMMTI